MFDYSTHFISMHFFILQVTMQLTNPPLPHHIVFQVEFLTSYFPSYYYGMLCWTPFRIQIIVNEGALLQDCWIMVNLRNIMCWKTKKVIKKVNNWKCIHRNYYTKKQTNGRLTELFFETKIDTQRLKSNWIHVKWYL
jgi:hypothetical protein